MILGALIMGGALSIAGISVGMLMYLTRDKEVSHRTRESVYCWSVFMFIAGAAFIACAVD